MWNEVDRQYSNYKQLGTLATTVVKAAPGVLQTVHITKAGDTTSLITIYDNATTGSGSVIAVYDGSLANVARQPLNAIFQNGCTVVISGTTAPQVTLCFQ